MTSTFSQLTLKNMTGFKIPSQLMLKCQRKNCTCVFEKISLKKETTEHFDMLWVSIKEEYMQIFNTAIESLLQFCTTYMCEQSYLSLLLIKNDKQSCTKNVDDELRVTLSSNEPNIKRLN